MDRKDYQLHVKQLVEAEGKVFMRFCTVVIEAVVKSWKDDNVDATVENNILWPVQFTQCKTDFERVRLLMQFPAVRKFKFDEAQSLVKCPESRSKLKRLSNMVREIGNSAWRHGDSNVALHWYNIAVQLAMDEEQKALAYANRSLVLVRLDMHALALEDIERAMQNNYPNDRRPRLLIRRAQCLLALGRAREAQDGFVKLQQQLQDSAASTDPVSSREPLIKLIQTGLGECAQALGRRVDRAKRSELNADPFLLLTYPDPPLSAYVKPRGKKGNKGQQSNPSTLFEITYGGDQVGWQLIATKNIEPGELITVDKPYARRLHADCIVTHCFQCFRRVLNPIPCRRCFYASFCSEACEKASWTPDWTEASRDSNPPTVEGRPCHRFDCGQFLRLEMNDYAGWKQLRQYRTDAETSPAVQTYRKRLLACPADICIGGPKVSSLAFACVARTPPWIILSLAQLQATTCENVDGDAVVHGSPLLAFSGQRQFPTGGLHADNYSAIGWLVTNSDKRSPHDLWQRTVAAVYLTHCLSAGGYPLDWDENCLLDPNSSNPLASTARLPASWAAACMLHHLQCVASNAHSFTVDHYLEPRAQSSQQPSSWSPPGVDLAQVEPIELASCLYPTLSLLNHSCDPNIALVFMRDGACGIFALQPIRKGHALYGNYGVHYATDSREERHELLLRQYHFECVCHACQENWSRLNYVALNLICQHCRGVFVLNEKSQNLQDCVLELGDRSAPRNRNRCHCPEPVRFHTMQRFMELVHCDLQDKMTSIPAQYSSLRFYQIEPKLLNKHIAYLTRMLDTAHLPSLLERPAIPFDWSQELLKTMLTLRYGCSYKESGIIADNVDALDLCNVC